MESQRYLYNLNNALDAFLLNRVRSFLTALGIIFGVAAVISMLAIGNGARQEILDQIKMVGVNNIIIMPRQAGQGQDDATATGNNNQQPATATRARGLANARLHPVRQRVVSVFHAAVGGAPRERLLRRQEHLSEIGR